MKKDFKFIKWCERDIICIESDRIEECMDYCMEKDVDGIYLSQIYGYRLSDIQFLKDYLQIKGLVISDNCSVDISGIEELKNLKFISFAKTKQSLDCSVFPDLEEIRNEWHPKLKITENCRKLKHLYLQKYNPKCKDISELPYLESIEYLGIAQSTITSTNGIGKYDKLNDLELYYMTKLEKLCDMESLKLERLSICNSKKIRNHEYVTILKSLQELKYNDCGEMPSISFIKDMPSLKDFRFVGTNVLDGDMIPCLGLEGCAFTSKRHFSHTYEQMCKFLENNA